jgi:hypothetical protein
VNLPAIQPGRRRTEEVVWARFEDARPRLFGALCSALADALARRPDVRLTATPRMADFAALGEAASGALGLSPGEFEAMYNRRAGDQHLAAVEASPLAAAVCRLLVDGAWQGSIAELLAELTPAPPHRAAAAGWPRSPQQLGSMLCAGWPRRFASSGSTPHLLARRTTGGGV